MILIIEFFDKFLSIESTQPLDLLSLGGGILLISAALFLTHKIIAHRSSRDTKESENPAA